MNLNRDDFTKVGGKLLGSGTDVVVLPRSGYDKESALSHFATKLDEHEQGAVAVRLTPSALKNLAKEQTKNPNKNTFQRGRVDYN